MRSREKRENIVRVYESSALQKGFGNFFEDRGGGIGGVGGLGDGAADNEVAGSETESFSRAGDAFLIADGGAGGADAGDDEHSFRAGEGAELSGLLG